MKLIHFRKCKPETIETDAVITVKFEENVSGLYDLVRGTHLLVTGNKYFDEVNYHPDCKYIFEQKFWIHNQYQMCTNVEFYENAIYECVSYTRVFEIKSIAIPILTYKEDDLWFDINEYNDYLENTFNLGFDTIFRFKEPTNLVFYSPDDSFDADKMEQKFKIFLRNKFLNEFEIKEINHDIDKSNNNKTDYFDDRLKDCHLPLNKFIEKYSGKAFSDFINNHINSTNTKGSDLYKLAQISKQDYHKMMTNPSLPKKQEKQKYDTVSLLLVSKPDIYEFNKMLASRGFALSDCRTKDLIIKYFIMNKNYSIFDINKELEKRNLSVIGNTIE